VVLSALIRIKSMVAVTGCILGGFIVLLLKAKFATRLVNEVATVDVKTIDSPFTVE